MAIVCWSIFAVFYWGDWKNWQRYYPTILYMITGNLLYNFLKGEHHLWKFEANLFLNHMTIDLLYTFVVFPCSVILFLTHCPDRHREQFLHFLKWIFIYAAIEWSGYRLGYISYYHGWNFLWSLFLVCIIFPMLKLHHIKTSWSWPISIVFTLLFLLIFDLPAT